MKEKRVTIKIPFELWKAIRELQTEGKVKSIQHAAITGIDNLLKSLKDSEEEDIREKKISAKQRVFDMLSQEKPLGNWEEYHKERTEADAGRS
jgi:hypothetical protein